MEQQITRVSKCKTQQQPEGRIHLIYGLCMYNYVTNVGLTELNIWLIFTELIKHKSKKNLFISVIHSC
jgi:hypothetical protein